MNPSARTTTPGLWAWLAGLNAVGCAAPKMSTPPTSPTPPPGPTGPGGLRVEDYVEGVRSGNRSMLGRAITLIESTAARHEGLAQDVLQQLLPATGRARRIGITGVPGVGKSTFIEALGCHLCDRGLRVAVLAIDPSSAKSRGSILGDKTRMERLSGEPNAFIRPSPTGGSLGGVARRTRETLLLCEAAGFDVVLVETVGVGQSETTLRSMVDLFLLLLLAGAGDDLQGIKRGIMEMADVVLINKADGDNRPRAEAARSEQSMALHYLAPPTPPWRPVVSLCSGLTGEGIPDFWQLVERFYAELGQGGHLERLRAGQMNAWLQDLVREEWMARFHRHPAVRDLRPRLEEALARGDITAVRAAQALLAAHDGQPPSEALSRSSTTPNPTPL